MIEKRFKMCAIAQNLTGKIFTTTIANDILLYFGV